MFRFKAIFGGNSVRVSLIIKRWNYSCDVRHSTA
jgi:hypothetical protein